MPPCMILQLEDKKMTLEIYYIVRNGKEVKSVGYVITASN